MKKSKIFLVVIGVLGALLVALYWMSLKNEPAFSPRTAKHFQLQDSENKLFDSSTLKGKPFILHFWAKWCEPCVDEIPDLIRFTRKLEEKNFQVVIISLDPSWDEAFQILPHDHLPKNMISLLDKDYKVSSLYGSFEYPETYLINKDFEIIAKWVGPQKWDDEEINQFILTLL